MTVGIDYLLKPIKLGLSKSHHQKFLLEYVHAEIGFLPQQHGMITVLSIRRENWCQRPLPCTRQGTLPKR